MILDLKEGKFWNPLKEEEGKMCHELLVLEINCDLWGKFDGLGSEILKGWFGTPQRNWDNIPDLLIAMPVKASVNDGKISH